MRAITVIPGKQGSVALADMPEPPAEDGPILVQTQAIGICGTDLEIISGEYGSAPPGQDRLIIGHESLGRVVEAAPETGFGPGDLVVGIVRRRDPVPCPACAAGDWDMCMNGQYTERGIKDRHGYASERYRIHPDYLVKVDPALGVLLEPATVVARPGTTSKGSAGGRRGHRRRYSLPAPVRSGFSPPCWRPSGVLRG
jgi:threonine dehydrogenase-like Zn-dependent dehydrogenase